MSLGTSKRWVSKREKERESERVREREVVGSKAGVLRYPSVAVAAAAGGSRAPAVREQPKGVADGLDGEPWGMRASKEPVGGGILKEGRCALVDGSERASWRRRSLARRRRAERASWRS